jgi:uncharacterized DUF497 family protein
VRFEWDPDKAASNLARHGLQFDEASTVFGDRLARTDLDPDHSESEERFTTIGMTLQGRVVVVWHADRVDADGEDVIRLIGARVATSSERRAYESGE